MELPQLQGDCPYHNARVPVFDTSWWDHITISLINRDRLLGLLDLDYMKK